MMQVNTVNWDETQGRKGGSDGGSKKRKEVGNDNSLVSMFPKQQAVSALDKAREEHNAQLQKGIEIGLQEAEQDEPVRRSDTDTHDIEGTETKMRQQLGGLRRCPSPLRVQAVQHVTRHRLIVLLAVWNDMYICVYVYIYIYIYMYI